MKGRIIVLDMLEGREAAALMVDGRLEDFFITGDGPPVGTIYCARATRPFKGQGGMFLESPGGTVFLRRCDGLAPGSPLLVQVTGYPENGKAVPVTSNISLKGKYGIVTPNSPGVNVSRVIRNNEVRNRLLDLGKKAMGDSGWGLILRSSCLLAESEEIIEDIHTLTERATRIMSDTCMPPARLSVGDGPHALARREWGKSTEILEDANGFEHLGVLDALDELRCGIVKLAGGGVAFVETTRALVAVDVNTGPDMTPAAGLKANTEIARALPRVLRILGLGGQVVIDTAPMPKRDRMRFETVLRTEFRKDLEDTVLVGWTSLGNYELQRKRERVPLEDVLS